MTLGSRDLALLRDFLHSMKAAGATCFMVGAGARVIAFDRRWNLRAGRATSDWDFAIRVDSWEHWSSLTDVLVRGDDAKFRRAGPSHRFVHVDGGVLDLVPYGGVETDRGSIVWPDQSSMSVHGFRESEGGRVFVDAEGLVVPIAGVPSLALLKLHAYRERRLRGERRDIQDFDWFLSNYESAGNELRVHDELGDVLRSETVLSEDAGAALLGLDVGRQHSREVIAPVLELLVEARDPWSRLIEEVIAGRRSTQADAERSRRNACRRIGAFESQLPSL